MGKPFPGVLTLDRIRDGRAGPDADDLVRGFLTERPDPPNEQCHLGTLRTGIGMGLIEYEEPQGRILEHPEILPPGEQVLELVHVREENSWRVLCHLLLGKPLLEGRDDDIRMVRDLLPIVGDPIPSLPFQHPFNIFETGRILRGRADVHAERDPGPGKEVAKTFELIHREGVHGVHDDRHDPGFRMLVPEPEGVVQDGV